MTPTREQFKDLIASIKKAQEKEDNLDKAFKLTMTKANIHLSISRPYGKPSINPSTSCLASMMMM